MEKQLERKIKEIKHKSENNYTNKIDEKNKIIYRF